MNKKFMSLAFVVVISGCHAPPQGAVCPAPEEEAAEPEPTADVPPDEEKISEEELEKARNRIRRNRFLPSR